MFVRSSIFNSKQFVAQRELITEKRRRWAAFIDERCFGRLLPEELLELIKAQDGVYPNLVEFQLQRQQILFDIAVPLQRRFYETICLQKGKEITRSESGRFGVAQFDPESWMPLQNSTLHHRLEEELRLHVVPLGQGLLSVMDAYLTRLNRKQLQHSCAPT